MNVFTGLLGDAIAISLWILAWLGVGAVFLTVLVIALHVSYNIVHAVENFIKRKL